MERTIKAVCYCYSFDNPSVLGYNDKLQCRGVAIHAAISQWLKGLHTHTHNEKHFRSEY